MNTTVAYTENAGDIFRVTRHEPKVGMVSYESVRILSSDDEYFTAIEWLTERGWL